MNYLISFHGHWGPKKLNSYCLVPPFLSHFSFNCASSTTTTLQVWELEEKGQGMLWGECRHGSSTAECCSPAVPCFAGSDMNCVTHSPETKLGNNASNSMTRVPAQLCCHRKSYRSFLLLNTIIVLPGHLLFFVCLFYFTVISKSKVAKITDNSHMHNQFLTFCHICFFLSIYSYIHTHWAWAWRQQSKQLEGLTWSGKKRDKLEFQRPVRTHEVKWEATSVSHYLYASNFSDVGDSQESCTHGPGC